MTHPFQCGPWCDLMPSELVVPGRGHDQDQHCKKYSPSAMMINCGLTFSLTIVPKLTEIEDIQ